MKKAGVILGSRFVYKGEIDPIRAHQPEDFSYDSNQLQISPILL